MSIYTTPAGINPYPLTLEDHKLNWQKVAKFAAAGAVGVDSSTGQLTIATALAWTVSSSGVIAKTAWTATWSGGVNGGNITQTYDGIYTSGFVAGSPQNNHFVVDLHAQYTLSRVTITSQATTVIPTSYTIEVSPDNVNWTSVTNNLIAAVITDYFFPSPIANMRYLRITPNSGTANGNWFVNELDIYGGGVGAATIITGSPTVGVSAGSIIRISGAFKKNASTDDWYCQLGNSTGTNGYRIIWTAGGVLKIQSVNASTPTDIGSNVNLTSDTALHYFNAVILVVGFNDASIVAQVDGNAACHVDNDSNFNLTSSADTVVVFTGDASKLWGFGYTTSKTVNGPTGSYPLSASSIPSTLGNTTIPTLTITGSIVYPAQVANTFWGGPGTGANATPTFRALVAADIPTTLGNITIGNLTITGALTLPTKTANFVFAGPTTGAAAVPAFRALVAADIPGTLGNTSIGNLTVTTALVLPSQTANSILAGPTTGAAAAPAFRALVAADIPGTLGNTTIGNLTVSGTSTNATDGNTSGAITIKNVSTSTAPIVVDTPTFQIADLQTWKAAGATKANISASGLLTVTGLTVSGSVQGAITFAGNILSQGNITSNGTIAFSGSTALSGATSISGALTIANATTTHGVGDCAESEATSLTTVSTTSGTYVDIGCSIALPVAGTYLVTQELRWVMQNANTTGNECQFSSKLVNTTAAADVANSDMAMAIVAAGAEKRQGTSTRSSIITVGAAATIKVQVAVTFVAGNAPAVAQIASFSGSGRSFIRYLRIA